MEFTFSQYLTSVDLAIYEESLNIAHLYKSQASNP
jgi:hypothetical protein